MPIRAYAACYTDYDDLQTLEPADPVLMLPSYIPLPNLGVDAQRLRSEKHAYPFGSGYRSPGSARICSAYRSTPPALIKNQAASIRNADKLNS